MRFKEGPRRWKQQSVAGWITISPGREGDILQGIALLEYDDDIYRVVKLESQRIDSTVWHKAEGEPEKVQPIEGWTAALTVFMKRGIEEQRGR